MGMRSKATCEYFEKSGSEISQLTTLRFDRGLVVMRHDSDTLRYDLIPRMRKAKLLPNKRKMKGILSPAEVGDLDLPETNVGRSGRLDDESSIIELMGVYQPRSKEVIVYDKMCEIVGARLDLDVETLKRVVAAHEVAHAITHVGEDEKDRIWYFFEEAKFEDKELFAQIYPLFHFRKSGDRAALSVFRRLADHQDDVYNLWKKYENSRVGEVNEVLMEKRLERLDDARLYGIEARHLLSRDGNETLVVTELIDKAQRIIQAGIREGRISPRKLDYLRAVVGLCSMAIKEDLGPNSPNYIKERYDYLRNDIAALKRSLGELMASSAVLKNPR